MQLLLILRLLLSLHLQYKGDISDHLISSDRYQRQSAQAAHSFPTYFAAPQLAAYLALHTSLPYLTGAQGISSTSTRHQRRLQHQSLLCSNSKVSRVSTRGAPVCRRRPALFVLDKVSLRLQVGPLLGPGRDQANETPVTLAAAFVQSARFKLNSLPLDHHPSEARCAIQFCKPRGGDSTAIATLCDL